MNQELELVESMDKLNILVHKFQTELLNGELKEYYSKTIVLYRIN